MLSWWRNKTFNIYSKLVVAFLVMMIPLFILNWFVLGWGSSIVQDEISNSMESKTSFYLKLLESDIQKIVKLQQEYVNDDDLILLSGAASRMSSLDITESVKRLQQKIALLKSSSTYISNASVHIPDMNQTISAEDFIKELPLDEMQGQLEAGNSLSPIHTWHNRFFINLVYPQHTAAGQTPLFLLSVELSYKEIQDTLAQFTINGQGGAILEEESGEWEIGNPDLMKKVNNNEDKYIVKTVRSDILGASLIMYVPEKAVMGPLNRYQNMIWILGIASLVIIFAFSFWIYRTIHWPLKHLVRGFRYVEKGDFNQSIAYKSKDEFQYLYNQFNKMVERVHILIQEVYEERYRSQLSELRQLQSQISPHFLYNSFFILYRMAKREDYQDILNFTKYLGEYFKFITQTERDEVRLDEEVNHARMYVEIQNIRFSKHIIVEFSQVPDQAKDVMVPRLIIQPIVENAFKHALEDKLESGMLTVLITHVNNVVLIVVEDNGNNTTEAMAQEIQRKLTANSSLTEGTGLVNVHRRLQLRFGSSAGLHVCMGKMGGLRVSIRIPI